MKFAIITDIHFGSPPFYKGENRIMSAVAEKCVKKGLESIYAEGGCQLIMQLGDLIQDNLTSPSTVEDEMNINYIAQILAKSPIPVHHVVGNHEPVNLPLLTIQKALDLSSLHYSFVLGGYQFIALFCHASNHSQMELNDLQMQWLKNELSSNTHPALIFIHHSLADQDLTGNYWFEGEPDRCLVMNRSEVRNILESSKKVKAVFNGHLHWNNLTVHAGIPYFTIQSIVENFKMDGVPSETVAFVEIDKTGIVMRVTGNNEIEFRHAFS